MSETVIDDRGLSAAEAAVRYALERTVRDPQFRWHMIGTETLARLICAEAERRGVSEDDVESALLAAIAKQPCEQPLEQELQHRIDELELLLSGRGLSPPARPPWELVHNRLRDWRRLYVEVGLEVDESALYELFCALGELR